MDKPLCPTEIAEFTAGAVFITEGHWRDSKLYGRLDNGRPVYIFTHNDKGLLTVMVNVPGSGKLSFRFQVFLDEATEARVGRLVRHFLAIHCRRVAEWETEQLLSA